MIDLERELRPVLDDAIAPKPFTTVRRRATTLRRRRRIFRATAVLSVAALVFFATVVATRPRSSTTRIVTTPTPRLTVGTPTTIRGFGVQGMISAFGSIWVSPAGRVERLDIATGRVSASIAVLGASDFRSLAAGAGSIWVDDTGTQTITRIDPVTNRVVARIKFEGPLVVDGSAFVDGRLWVAHPEPEDITRGDIVVIDPATNRVVEHVAAPRTFYVVGGTHALWYVGGTTGSDLVRVDTSTLQVSVVRHDVNAVLAVPDGRLWLLTPAGVIETDEATGAQIGDPIAPVAPVNVTLTVTPGVVWIGGQPDSASPGSVTPYDVVTHGVLHAPIPVGFPILTMIEAGSAVWVDSSGITRIPFDR